MKYTLLILRHAKSSWDDSTLSDRERPLNKRGKKDAPMMGKRLKSSNYKCDLLITSPAVRALSTAKAVAKALGYPEKKILLDESLYMADTEDYLHVIGGVDEKIKHLMIVSHNPGSEELLGDLTSEQFEKFPTAAYALIEIEGSWSEIKSAKLLRFDYPKSL
ncbi:MAG: histidine phosphatase family protein [Campylobacterota bacterium]|nr:histidine phosphatase family protein [Campylobacterota bacterium]